MPNPQSPILGNIRSKVNIRWIVAAVIVLALCSACSQETLPVLPKARHERHVFAGRTPPPAQPMENPFKGDPDSVAAGRELFGAMHCDGCHAGDAAGAAGPSLADGRWRYGGSAAEIFESIYAGRPNGMPAFGGVLSKEATWRLVTYLGSLAPPADPATISFE